MTQFLKRAVSRKYSKIWFRFTSEIKVEQENYHNEMITTMIVMITTTQDRYNSEESLEEENQSTTSSTESRQSDFAKKDDGFIPTRRSDHQTSRKYKTQIQIKCT